MQIAKYSKAVPLSAVILHVIGAFGACSMQHQGLLSCLQSTQGFTSDPPFLPPLFASQGVIFTPAPLFELYMGLDSYLWHGWASYAALEVSVAKLCGLQGKVISSPPPLLPFAPLSGPAAVPRDCLSNRTRHLTNLQVACDLSAGITVALATTAPQLLKPLVPSAEGLAAILMQVKTSSTCLTSACECTNLSADLLELVR